MELLQLFGLSVLAFIFVLGVMIFVHELGHCLMAKRLGIRVEVFSLGFGPRLAGFKRGETEYRVSLIPLGGYVKMAGENYDEELTGASDEFMSRPKRHRFLVAVAGPVMNLALAVVLLSASYMVGIRIPSFLAEPPVIGKIEENSPAARTGLRIHDRIAAIDGEETPTWQKVEFLVGTSPNQTLLLTLERDGQLLKKEIRTEAEERSELGTIGAGPFVPYIISRVEPGSPAEQAGLQAGDRILRVEGGGRAAFGFADIPELIKSQKGNPLQFEVKRGAELFRRAIAPVQMDDQVRIGIVVDPLVTEKYGFFEAVGKSVRRNYELTLLTFTIVGKLLTGKASLRTMSGPIDIARFSGAAASAGLTPLMGLMALISLQLGILNLFPIPILDGGVITLLALEALMGRDLSMGVKERIAQIGFIFLVLLMGIVLFNDLSKNLPILK